MKTWSSIRRLKLELKSKFLLTLVIASFPCFVALAEYRAFQYLVKSNSFTNTIISTHNPVTFLAYHGEPEQIEINLIKTWMCPGYTGQFKPICPAPEKQILDTLKDRELGVTK